MKNYLKSAQTFETGLRAEQEKRISFFKTVAFSSIAANVAMAIALASMMPLKKVEPYVIQVDRATGNQAVITSLTETSYTPTEAEDRANIARYVKTREGYVYDTIQRDFNQIKVTSSPAVFKEYDNFIEGPNSPSELKDAVILEPHIISISLENSNGKKTALIRIEVTRKQVAGEGQGETSKTRLVTLSYDYYDLPMSDEERLTNPLGFRIDYYHAEDESLPTEPQRPNVKKEDFDE